MSEGIHFRTPEGNEVVAHDDYDALAEQLNPSRVALVIMTGRVGARSLITFLEYKFFPPNTPMNAHFRFAIVNWQTIKWFVIIIHKKYLPEVDRLCKLFGLRRADGVPHVFTFPAPGFARADGVASIRQARHAHDMAAALGAPPGTVVEVFPLDGPNVWTIENIEGHFTYDNDRGLEQKARDFENLACDSLIAEHQRRRDDGEFDHAPGTMPPKRV